ncbi:hypothetical protein FIA58_002620 [Flavobacterium jejuense]|uniref:Uncharacterized protein n=1 Tax=Flavobacterium jejuense TaxID=1544455 RepID=A0ABX0ILT6_9FLAO|nr:hypothetical protein [Flavobacterium jejuense]NHN24558.1 hypothetical protein [Flavobacterium jejuense]
MIKKLRHITIETKTYNYVIKEWQLKLFVDTTAKNKFIIVDFKYDIENPNYTRNLIWQGCFRVYKGEEELVLNMHEPHFVKEVIVALAIEQYDFSKQKHYKIEKALFLLEKMGYNLEKSSTTSVNKEQHLKQTTVHEVLLALKQDKLPLTTALIFDALDCTLLEAKKIAENMKKRII